MNICKVLRAGLAPLLLLSGISLSAATLTQCPPATVAGSAYTGCNFLITENANGSFTTAVDFTQPFFGGEDNYAGFQNNTSHAVSSIVINGNGTTLFGFDGDGPGSTANGLTGYEGPNNTYTNISADTTTGTVKFNTPIAPGGSAFFYLEESLSPNAPPPTGGGGGGGNPGTAPEPASVGLMGSALLGFGVYLFRRKR